MLLSYNSEGFFSGSERGFMTEQQNVTDHGPMDENIVLLDKLEQVHPITELPTNAIDTSIGVEEDQNKDVTLGEEDQNNLDDLDEIEFLLDEIEDQIAPLAL